MKVKIKYFSSHIVVTEMIALKAVIAFLILGDQEGNLLRDQFAYPKVR